MLAESRMERIPSNHMNAKSEMMEIAGYLVMLRMRLIEAGLCETAVIVGKAVEKVGWEISKIMTK